LSASVTLFIPFRNEIDGLKEIMPKIDPRWVDQIFLLDGNSTDGSKEFLETKGFNVVSQKSKGVKAAFWEAFDQINTDVIIPFSPDGNSNPQDIPKLVEKIQEGYDIVVASRYFGGRKSLDDDTMSCLANRLLTNLINLLFRCKLTDGIGMYKAFKRRDLYELGIDRHRNEHSEIMLLTRGIRYGLKIVEIDSEEGARIGPEGSRAHPGVFGKYKSGLLLIKTILRDALLYRPLNQRASS
jgi:glycosyltransferase involved in cell wall biosynthesis